MIDQLGLDRRGLANFLENKMTFGQSENNSNGMKNSKNSTLKEGSKISNQAQKSNFGSSSNENKSLSKKAQESTEIVQPKREITPQVQNQLNLLFNAAHQLTNLHISRNQTRQAASTPVGVALFKAILDNDSYSDMDSMSIKNSESNFDSIMNELCDDEGNKLLNDEIINNIKENEVFGWELANDLKEQLGKISQRNSSHDENSSQSKYSRKSSLVIVNDYRIKDYLNDKDWVLPMDELESLRKSKTFDKRLEKQYGELPLDFEIKEDLPKNPINKGNIKGNRLDTVEEQSHPFVYHNMNNKNQRHIISSIRDKKKFQRGNNKGNNIGPYFSGEDDFFLEQSDKDSLNQISTPRTKHFSDLEQRLPPLRVKLSPKFGPLHDSSSVNLKAGSQYFSQLSKKDSIIEQGLEDSEGKKWARLNEKITPRQKKQVNVGGIKKLMTVHPLGTPRVD